MRRLNIFRAAIPGTIYYTCGGQQAIYKSKVGYIFPKYMLTVNGVDEYYMSDGSYISSCNCAEKKLMNIKT